MRHAVRTTAAPLAFALIATAAIMAGARAAHGSPPEPAPRRSTGLGVARGELLASVGLQDLFGPAERERLLSGFATRVLIRVAVEEQGTDEPVAVAYQRTEIVYDIWDEKFRLRVMRGSGSEVHVETRTPEEAIARATTLWQFPVMDARRLRQGTAYVLVVRGDLNPISEELLSDVRRWLLEPGRGGGRVRAGDSFFGSFVSIFVNPRVEDSERQVRFWSQPFAAPPPRPPPPARAAPRAAPDDTKAPAPAGPPPAARAPGGGGAP